MNENVNKRVEMAMDSLDGIQQASPRPFFFTRLEARMLKERSRWERVSTFIARPVVVVSCICLVVVINLAVIFSSAGSTDILNGAGISQSEVATADEYSQVSSNFYEFVNNKP